MLSKYKINWQRRFLLQIIAERSENHFIFAFFLFWKLPIFSKTKRKVFGSKTCVLFEKKTDRK